MKPVFFMFIFCFGCFLHLSAQSEKNTPSTFQDVFSEEEYSTALPYYIGLLKRNPTNANLNFKAGMCYLHSRSQKWKAAEYLEKAADIANTRVPADVYSYLGDAYVHSYKFEKALEAYEKYKKTLDGNNSISQQVREELNIKINVCRSLKDLDKLLCIPPLEKFEDGKYFEENHVLVAVDSLQQQISISESEDKNDATVGTSMDNHYMMIYENNNGEANLFTSNLNGNHWGEPEKINKHSNVKGWEPNEFVSADGTALYFTSSREGGYGGSDIYTCKKLPGGEWSKATNLGASINSALNEEAPFIHPDGATLFFSSSRFKPKGGFDVFSTTLSDAGIWSEPQNIGYPKDTNNNPVLYAASTSAEPSKVIRGNAKEKPEREKGNYLISFLGNNKKPITILKGRVEVAGAKVPENTVITVSDNERGESAGIYHVSNTEGRYAFFLIPGRSNNITYEAEGFLFHSENIDISDKTTYLESYKTVRLDALASGAKVILNNIFFVTGKTTLRQASEVELEKIFTLLKSAPLLHVEISCYAESNVSSREDKLFSEKRAEAVKKYLVDKGIAQERIVAKGYGKSKTKNQKKIVLDNIRSKPANERVELKVLKVD